MKINNRRYLGNKYKLLPFIEEVVRTHCPDVQTVFDVFAGTGAVASAFLDRTVIVNDILYSNHLAHVTWFSSEPYDSQKLAGLIDGYNRLSAPGETNYMTENFADTFFSREVCAKIGHIREDIEQRFSLGELTFRERAILITSLLYAMDKIATTCGHYDAYRKGAEFNNDFLLELPEIRDGLSAGNLCFNTDSNLLAGQIECDLAYLDPPYNSRQYCDAYHLLENIAQWEKPVVHGVARKMDRTHLKSDYCTNKATAAFEELIGKLQCKYILLSYNNTADTANERSNARITDEDILRILSKKGTVTVFSQSYRAFSAGKSENTDNAERLFLCTVNTAPVLSPLNYTGGKARLLPQLLPLFPQNISSRVDLFCGVGTGGANTPARQHYYNDNMVPLMGLLRTLSQADPNAFLSRLDELIRTYSLSNSMEHGYAFYGCNSADGLGAYNREGFTRLKKDFNSLTPEDPSYYEMFFLLIVFSFNHQIRFNSAGKFNLPVGKRDLNPKIRQKLVRFMDRLRQQAPAFSSVSFEQFDLSVLDADSFVYCDPPYLISTATYNENGKWTETEEIALLAFLDHLNERGIRFGLSNIITHKGKTNDLLLQWAEQNGYTIHLLNYSYKNSSYQSKHTDQPTQEVLVTNY